MSITTVILVHGALLTSQAWQSVQNYLQNHQVNVITMDVPGRSGDHVSAKQASLDLAADKLCKIVNKQSGTVILAAHSQGGAVITQAVEHCGKRINGLIYITAVVPHNGENAFELLSDDDNQHFAKIAKLQNGVYQLTPNSPIHEMFMADADKQSSKIAISNMVPEPARLGDDVLHYNQGLFNSIPKFYIKTSQDKIISPETQDKYIKREYFERVYVLKSSHSPFVSQPDSLGEKVLEASRLVTESNAAA